MKNPGTARVWFTKPALLAVGVAVMLMGAGRASAQALDGFDPNANNIVRVVTVQPDGKILIGGIFTEVAPNGGPSVPRNRIARFHPDGTLDAAFDPNANSDVFAIAVQPDGAVLVGGYFTSIGGTNRNRIARLDPVTGQADSFNPHSNELVRTIVIESGGTMLVGGDFSNIGGTNRSRIARLSSSGVADPAFNPAADSFASVYTIVPDSSGKLLVGGTFTSIGGQSRNRIARLNAANGMADDFNPGADGDVLCLALQADGKILAGGFFAAVGGESRANLARLDPITGQADSFNPGANTTVQTLAVQSDGRIIAGGGFTSIGGEPRGRLARLDPNTGLADSFNPNAGAVVTAVRLQSDGAIVVGGNFTTMSTQPRGRVARFSPPPRPSLTIRPAANTNIVLSWPTNFSGYTLEASTNLVLNTWSAVSPLPVASGTNNFVTNAATGPARFFRLRE